MTQEEYEKNIQNQTQIFESLIAPIRPVSKEWVGAFNYLIKNIMEKDFSKFIDTHLFLANSPWQLKCAFNAIYDAFETQLRLAETQPKDELPQYEGILKKFLLEDSHLNRSILNRSYHLAFSDRLLLAYIQLHDEGLIEEFLKFRELGSIFSSPFPL